MEKFKTAQGYENLANDNKASYLVFAQKITEAGRVDLIPKAINYVESTEFLVKEQGDDFTVVGGLINVIDKNGMKSFHSAWGSLEQVDKAVAEHYLRFEYDDRGRNEWLHIINEGKEWY